MNHPLMAKLRNEQAAAFGLVMLRLATGAVFIAHGWPKLAALEKTAGFFGKIGIPAPEFFAPLVGTVEVFGGALLILGLATRFWAAGLAINMGVAIFAAKGLAKFSGYEFELALMAVSVFLFLNGAGKWSLDALLFQSDDAAAGSRPAAPKA